MQLGWKADVEQPLEWPVGLPTQLSTGCQVILYQFSKCRFYLGSAIDLGCDQIIDVKYFKDEFAVLKFDPTLIIAVPNCAHIRPKVSSCSRSRRTIAGLIS